MSNRLLDYLPPMIGETREFIHIMDDAEQPEFDQLWEVVNQTMLEQFIADASEYGVSRWENIMGITPKPNETLDQRKFTILVRLTEQLPFTMRVLEQQLENLCGKNGYTINLFHNDYALYVEVALQVKSKYDDVEALLRRIVPANLLINLSLKYNRHGELRRYTHGELSAFTHEAIRMEVLP